MKKKVLLTYMESGMGHITSIRSISDALKRKNLDDIEIIDSWVMQEDKNPTLIKFNNFIIQQTKNTNKIKGFGTFIFAVLEILGRQKFMVLVHHTLFRKALKETLKVFDKYKPDVIVSTHYFMTLAGIEYKKKYNKNCSIITYNPDNNVHVWWDNRDGLFIVNNEEAEKEAVRRRHFNPEKVKRVYFTAREDIINAEQDKMAYREKYGIDKQKFCVMLADGAYASANSVAVAHELLKTDLPLTIIMLAGKNEKVYNEFKELESKTKPNITLITQGFTPKAYELYCASDLFITKAGPNAILDSVFMGTPILVDYYAHPIEKATTKLFVEKFKCGLAIYKPKKIHKQVEQFIMQPDLLSPYIENCKKFDKFQNGADDVANFIVNQLKENQEPKTLSSLNGNEQKKHKKNK